MNWKKLLPLILGMALCAIFGIYVLKSLDAGDHSPTGVFNNEYNGEGILEGFSYE